MAFHAFGSRGVEWAVIETGMGGRLDATNVLDPRVSVITNISLEHRSYLGDTIAAIAGEKAGIIKPGRPAVTAATQPDALRVLEQTAQEKQAPLYRKGRDFRIRRKPDGTFHYFGDAHRWRNLRTALEGPHQADNAALALAACERLIESGVPISEDAIRSGLQGTRWPGRLEVVMEQPLVVLDGAHNLMAARNLARYLEHRMKGRRLSLVIGILDDKPADAMLAALLPMADRVFVTQARIDRAIPAEVLARRAERRHADVTVIPDVARAVAAAVDGSGPQDAVCIAGSLYVVGEAVPAVERIAPGRGPEAPRTG
jgi:dihydrofolate synthase/folylpolyglutamate synthase